MPDPLLSSLCTICHVRPHKYRCPRCFILTCSLPCIKRHKQWAQCNGVRDPTKYMKRSDLATPRGIDHDYNYLTSIERELDHGEKNALSRGFVLEEEERRRSRKQPVKGETRFDAALERCGVVVAKAPKGMTRSKLNGTICSRKNRTLRWTVEWVHPDGNKTMDSLWETQCVSAAYDDHLRYLHKSGPKKRRKPDAKGKDHALPVTFATPSVPAQDSAAREPPNPSTATVSVGKRKREEEEEDIVNRNPGKEAPNTIPPTDPGSPAAIQPPAPIPAPSDASPVPAPAPKADLTFHLHHPSLPSRQPVLIPLPPDAKLATSLTNRLVHEFPTIYVLHSPPDGKQLPEAFVSEEEFFSSAKRELVRKVGEDVSVGAMGVDGAEVQVEELEDGEVDEDRLLEVLGRDLSGVAGAL